MKIRIGVLGCANIAEHSVIPAIISLPALKLVAVASRNIEKAKRFAVKFGCDAIEGYHNLLSRNDIEAVYVPLPHGLHFEWVKKALKYNKHVLVEKSTGCNLQEVQDMIALAKIKKLCLQENFQFLFHSQHQHVKDLLNADEIGEIRCFRSSFGFPPFKNTDNIRYQKSLGGGALLDAGAYPLKATHFMLGNGFEVKSAVLNYNKTLGIDLYGGAFLSNNKGIFSEVAFGFDNFYQCNYEIWGSKGKITIERAFTAGPNITPTIKVEKQNELNKYQLPYDNHFVNILKDFANAIIQSNYDRYYNEILNQAKLIQQVLDKANEK